MGRDKVTRTLFKFIYQGQQKNNGNFPDISLLSCQFARSCVEKMSINVIF